MLRLILAITLLSPVLAAEATITSIFRDPVSGTITKLDQQARLEVQVKGGDVPERISLDEVEEVTFGFKGDERKPEDAPIRVYLVNGDVLHGAPEDGPADDEETFLLKGTRFGTLAIHVNAVKRIEIVRNVQPNALPELEKGAKGDVTYFAKDGSSPEQTDPGSELVRVVKDGCYLYNEHLDEKNYAGKRFAWSRLRGVVCLRTGYKPSEKLVGICTMRDGSVISGAIKAWGEGKITLQHTVLGKDIVLDESAMISVAMKNGRYTYLSDMEFAETPVERPYYLPGNFKYEDHLFKVRKDRAQGGGALSIRGKAYAKGLGVHAISKLTYDMNRGYKRFIADVGLDDGAGDLGSVEFKVYADGKLIWESGVLRRTTDAKTIDVEILNVTRLVLEVTATSDGDVQDRANWANAKVVR